MGPVEGDTTVPKTHSRSLFDLGLLRVETLSLGTVKPHNYLTYSY